MQYAIIQMDRLPITIKHAIPNQTTQVPVVSYPLLSARKMATALEVPVFFIEVAVPIGNGLHRIVHNNV